MLKVAIVGAGWAGISCLKKFLDDKYEVDVFERYDDVGGVWHPNNKYMGLHIHSQALTIEFPDFPLPENIDRYSRLPSEEVYRYMKAYCKEKSLYKYMNFNHKVEKINYISKLGKLDVHYVDLLTSQSRVKRYDYVVNTIGWNVPLIPQFANQQSYKGQILHAYQASEEVLSRFKQDKKKIVILGAGKAAADLNLAFHDLNYPVQWLYRKSYWFWNFSLQDRYFRNQLSLFQKYKFMSSLILGLLLIIYLPAFLGKIGYGVLRRNKIIHTPGETHHDYRKFHHGRLDEMQVSILKDYSQISGEIQELTENGIILTDGRKVDADVILCCTGSSPKKNMIALEIDDKPFDINSAKKIYRHSILPEIPQLIFTFFTLFSFGMVNAVSRANWISAYIKKNLSQADVLKQSIPRKEDFFDGPFNGNACFIKKIESHLEDYCKRGDINKFNFISYSLAQHFRSKLFPLNFN